MEMKEYVVELLQGYNGVIEEILALEFEIKSIKKIDNAELLTSLILPGGADVAVQSNLISNPTANIALSYEEDISKIKMESIKIVADRLFLLQQQKNRLDFYINNLPAHYANILKQYYFEGYSWPEIEALTGVGAKTLRMNRNKAIELLVERYQKIQDLGVI